MLPSILTASMPEELDVRVTKHTRLIRKGITDATETVHLDLGDWWPLKNAHEAVLELLSFCSPRSLNSTVFIQTKTSQIQLLFVFLLPSFLSTFVTSFFAILGARASRLILTLASYSQDRNVVRLPVTGETSHIVRVT